MAKPKKLTKQEVENLKSIQYSNKAIVEEFGKINILELDLDSRKKRAVNFLTELRTLEQDTAKTLEEKYGKGTVNTDTGEFTKLEE